MSVAQPTVTGTLGKTPLLHILISLLERTATGTIVVETAESVRSALYVERGVPTKIRLGNPEARLSDVLVQMGYLKGDAGAASYERAVRAGTLHGQQLVQEGVIEESNLLPSLRMQLIRKLLVAAALPPTAVFGFYEGTDYLAKWRGGSVPVSPLAAAWALALRRADPETVSMMTHRIAGHPLRLHKQGLTSGFGFDRDEQAVIDVLRARPQTLESLGRLGITSLDRLERIAYVLTLTRHLDFGRDLRPLGVGAVAEGDEALLPPKESLRPSRPVVLGVSPEILAERAPTPSAATSSVAVGMNASEGTDGAKAKVSPQSLQRIAQFEKMAADLDTKDYFQLLGVERGTSGPIIQETFLKLAKIYHPDKLPEEAADLRPLATRIFARLSEALQTLTDPAKEKTYLETLTRGPVSDEEEKVRRVLRAAGNYHRAEVLLKKRMLAAAELEARRALEEDPEQPDYRALYAWIQSCMPDGEARLPELIKQISEAIEQNGDSEKNRYYRVQLLKRTGRTEEAVADCRVIVARNPHHVDALREIRLWGMRHTASKGTGGKPGSLTKTASGKGSTPPASKTPSGHPSRPPPPTPGGILGRLFKR